MEDADVLPPGSTLTARLRIVRVLGSGGQAVVYEVEDTATSNHFAAKLLRDASPDPQDVARLEREAIAAARIDHPHVARVYGLDRADDGRVFVLMELLEGRSLNQFIAEGVLELGWACEIAIDVAGAISAAHAAGLVHRDLKPSNIFVATAPQICIKVLDFGIAKIVDEAELTRLTDTGSFIGTPEYMAPEQAGGKVADPRWDVYALGVVLFKMVTGRVPFSGSAGQILRDKLFRAPPNPKVFRPNLPQPLAAFILRALAREPNERFESMDRFMTKLKAAMSAPSQRPNVLGNPSADPTGVAPQHEVTRPTPDASRAPLFQPERAAEIAPTKVRTIERATPPRPRPRILDGVRAAPVADQPKDMVDLASKWWLGLPRPSRRDAFVIIVASIFISSSLGLALYLRHRFGVKDEPARTAWPAPTFPVAKDPTGKETKAIAELGEMLSQMSDRAVIAALVNQRSDAHPADARTFELASAAVRREADRLFPSGRGGTITEGRYADGSGRVVRILRVSDDRVELEASLFVKGALETNHVAGLKSGNVVAFGIGPGWHIDNEVTPGSFFIARIDGGEVTLYGLGAGWTSDARRLFAR